MDQPLSAEVRFLLAACCVGPIPPPSPHRIDPSRLLRLAQFHRVAGLVYESRERLPLPPDAVAPFRAATMATLHRNLQFAAELKLALHALNAAGAPVILLKGAHLMDAVYHNPALRPLSDLDILVRPEHAQTAMEALRAVDYATDPRRAAFGLRSDGEARLEKSGVHDLVIELHTTLNRATRHHWFPMDALWRRSEAYAFEGVPARVLCPADNLCFLCAHAVPHLFSQLSWIRDIAGVWEMLSGASDSPGEDLMQAACDASARRAVFAGLHVARTALGAGMEASLPDAIAGPAAARLKPLLSSERLFVGTHYSTLQSLRFRAALSDDPRRAAAILGASFFRKAAEMSRGLSTSKQRRSMEA
ncbi:MAG TPA: nucleotidyltransferase family protein [Armatimonadota bacterium]|jgi:hypothetical protein